VAGKMPQPTTPRGGTSTDRSAAPPRTPHGSDPTRGLVEQLLHIVQGECSAAAARHEDVLSQLRSQEESFKGLLSQMNAKPIRASTASGYMAPLDLPSSVMNALPKSVVNALESKMKKASADDDGFVRPVLYATNSGGFATDDDGFACSLGEGEQDVEDEDVDVSPSGSRDGVCPRHTDLAKNHGLQFGKNAMRKRISITEALIPYWRIWVYNAVTHPRFDMALASAIMANAVVLCFEVQYNGLQVGFDLQYQKYRADAKTVWPGRT